MKKIIFTILVVLVFYSSYGQSDTTSRQVNLHEIEITASSLQNRSQLNQPLSIVRLQPTELKRGTGLFFDDAINGGVPGVYMARRTNSGSQQFNIRGYGSGMGFKGISNNFDNQGMKIYLNGIPITDAEGITVLDDIDFGSVSQADILKGPSGTLYGLAIAGVIHLQTQKAERGKVSVGQDFMAGSYGLLRTTTRIAIGGERSSLFVNYGHQKFDGFMPHTASHKDFVNVMGDATLSRKQNISYYLGFSDSYDQRNGELSIGQYDTLNYSGSARYIKNDAHSALKSFRAGLNHTYRFTSNISNTTTFFGSSQVMDQSSAANWTDKLPLNYGLRSVFDTRFKLSEKLGLKGSTGLELQKMNALTVAYSMAADSNNLSGYNIINKTTSNQATTSAVSSLFTQWVLEMPHEFSLTAGIGVSSMKLKLEDRLWALTNNRPNNKKLKIFESTYNQLVSTNIALNKKISDQASVYAAFSTGYKAPVASNVLIATTGQLNTGLKPEKGTQIEIGTKGSLLNNRLFYTLALFQIHFENKFTTVAVPDPSNTVTLYTYLVNGGVMNNQGLEFLAQYKLIESDEGFFRLVQPFANIAYSNFKYGKFTYDKIGKDASNHDVVVTEDYNGNTVAGVPPLVYNIGIDAETNIGFYGNLNYNYRSSMYITSDEKVEARAYGLLNAKVGFRKSFGHFEADLYAGVSNITSQQYYQMVFINQLPDSFIPGPNEINFFGGFGLKYTF